MINILREKREAIASMKQEQEPIQDKSTENKEIKMW